MSEVDFTSGAGPPSGGQRTLITDLGVFDLESGSWRARSLHDGVTAEAVSESTAFEISTGGASITPPLSDDEIGALDAVDPYGLRHLEAAPDLEAMAAQIARERSA